MKRPLLLYITILVQIVVAVWAPFFWKRSIFPQRCIIVLLVEMALSSVIELVMGMYHIHNLWVIHFSHLIEYAIILTMFYNWKNTQKEKYRLLILGGTFLLFWFVSKLFIESFSQMDTYSYTVAQIIYIALAASMLFDVLKDSKTLLKHDARIWIASGMMIYSAGTLFVFSFFNIILASTPELLNTVWQVNWILVIVAALFYARGIWCNAPQEGSIIKGQQQSDQ